MSNAQKANFIESFTEILYSIIFAIGYIVSSKSLFSETVLLIIIAKETIK